MSTIYLPSIGGGTDYPAGMNTLEAQLFTAVRDHPDQQRAQLIPHTILCAVARARALDMLERIYFSHVDPEGVGPNQHAAQAGFALPDDYPLGDANSIESIARDYATPDLVVAAWLTSPHHRVHILGEAAFFQRQLHCGIGVAGTFKTDGTIRAGFYYVFISAAAKGD